MVDCLRLQHTNTAVHLTCVFLWIQLPFDVIEKSCGKRLMMVVPATASTSGATIFLFVVLVNLLLLLL